MNLKISFSWIGFVVFALPILINIAYAIFPPSEKAEQVAAVTHWIEMVEQISRIAYLFAITLLVSRNPINFRSTWFCLAALWLHNIPAAILMMIFGAAHLTVSVQSFR